MIRLVKWVGFTLVGLLALVLLAALLLPTLVNLDRYRAVLAGRVGKALGREVTLGALRISFWGGLGAEAKGIQIAQAAGFGSEPFLAADALRVHVHVLPLLRGQVKVSTAVLERPRIRLTRARDGRWSVDDLLKAHTAPPPPRPPGEPARPGKAPLVGGLVLSEVSVHHGELTLLDQTRTPGTTFALADLDLSLRQASVSEPLEVRSRATIGTTGSGRIEASGRIMVSDPDNPILNVTVALRDVETAPWQALLLGGDGTKVSGPLSADITVTGPLSGAVFAGNLNLKAATVEIGDAFRKAAGEEARLTFEGRREDQGVAVSKLTLTVKEVKADASLRIPDLRAPRLTFTATSAKLDLDRLLAKPAPKTSWLRGAMAFAAVPSRSGTPASAAVPALAAQGRVSIGDLRFRGLTWTAVQADIRYQDGVARLPDVRANFMNGRVTAKGEIDLRPKLPQVSLTSRMENVATEPLTQALAHGSWTLRSTLNSDSAVTFVGSSPSEILGSAAGTGFLLAKDGRLTGYKPLDRLSEVISPFLAGQGIRVRLNEFDQVSGHYTLDKGVLRTKDLTLTNTEGTVTAVGSLDLLDSTLNFDVVAKLGRTTVEAKVTGTTSQPIVVPKLGRFQQKIETELDKVLPDQQGKKLKDLFRGLFGR